MWTVQIKACEQFQELKILFPTLTKVLLLPDPNHKLDASTGFWCNSSVLAPSILHHLPMTS